MEKLICYEFDQKKVLSRIYVLKKSKRFSKQFHTIEKSNFMTEFLFFCVEENR